VRGRKEELRKITLSHFAKDMFLEGAAHLERWKDIGYKKKIPFLTSSLSKYSLSQRESPHRRFLVILWEVV
jgi:hypothetical protein